MTTLFKVKVMKYFHKVISLNTTHIAKICAEHERKIAAIYC